MEARVGEHPRLAAGPRHQPHLGQVGAGLEAQPRQRRVGRARPAASSVRHSSAMPSSPRYGSTTEWKTTVATPGAGRPRRSSSHSTAAACSTVDRHRGGEVERRAQLREPLQLVRPGVGEERERVSADGRGRAEAGRSPGARPPGRTSTAASPRERLVDSTVELGSPDARRARVAKRSQRRLRPALAPISSRRSGRPVWRGDGEEAHQQRGGATHLVRLDGLLA